jgi:hypothetical protein
MLSFLGGNPSVTTWLNKIKSRFGNEYYNEMMNYLAEGNSSSY